MTNRHALPIALLALALATGCASDQPATSATPSTTAAADDATTTTAAPTEVDLGAVIDTLTDAGATNPWIATAETDPNSLLGRPGQYTARAGLDYTGGDPEGDTGRIERGIVVEVHPTAADATKRATFIADTLKANPILGTEWHYTAGPVLVRVHGKVTPANAKKIEEAVATLPR